MPIVVNSNAAATQASFNLSKANDALHQKLGEAFFWKEDYLSC